MISIDRDDITQKHSALVEMTLVSGEIENNNFLGTIYCALVFEENCDVPYSFTLGYFQGNKSNIII